MATGMDIIVIITVIINPHMYESYLDIKTFLWQALKIEEYDWYGYGETYGSEAELRSNYRYKQVWVMGM